MCRDEAPGLTSPREEKPEGLASSESTADIMCFLRRSPCLDLGPDEREDRCGSAMGLSNRERTVSHCRESRNGSILGPYDSTGKFG